MKRIILALLPLCVLFGCKAHPEKIYTHVVENDYISDTYYIAEIEPREPGDLTPTDYGVFIREEPGAYRLLLNIGAYTDIYPARNRTLVREHVLYQVDGQDIVSYRLRDDDPPASLQRIEGFFPEEMDVIILNALNDSYVYVYAELNFPAPAHVYRLNSTSEPFKPYLAYFAVLTDGGGYREISQDLVPVQKRQ